MIRSGGGGSSTSVERAFKLADARSERLAAVIRIAIFAAIMVAVVAAQSTGFDHRPLEAAGAIYGGGTLAGLAIAWRGFYRAWLPYVFVAFDVLTLGGMAFHPRRCPAIRVQLRSTRYGGRNVDVERLRVACASCCSR